MDKKCSACGKTVYPLEQLKCLDQIFHKTCFKCTVCGMTLNMKNYKGYDKKPYCSAHYPQPSAYTIVTDNPEMQRVKQNTAVISNVKYHEEFEKAKGQKISVTDDPLTNQQMQNMQTISNVAYTGKTKANQPLPPSAASNSASSSIRRPTPTASTPEHQKRPGSIFNYDPEKHESFKAEYDPKLARRGSSTIQVVPTPTDDTPPPVMTPPAVAEEKVDPPAVEKAVVEQKVDPPAVEKAVVEEKVDPPAVEKAVVEEKTPEPPVADPISPSDTAAPVNSSFSGQSTVYTSSIGRKGGDGDHSGYQQRQEPPRQQYQEPPRQQYQEPPRQQYQEPPRQQHQEPPRQQYQEPPRQQHQEPPRQQHQEPPRQYEAPRQAQEPVRPASYQEPAPPPAAQPQVADKGKLYRALYDYTANDEDEVSFNENDLITNGDPIDEGWMYGTVERTGQHGMLPSNYVEPL